MMMELKLNINNNVNGIAKISNAAWKNAKMKDIAFGSHVLFTTDMGISWSGWDENIETTETFANAIFEECKKQSIEVLQTSELIARKIQNCLGLQ